MSGLSSLCYHEVPANSKNDFLLVQSVKASSPRKDPAQRIAVLVQSVILVKEMLSAMPGLAKVLAPAQSELLKAVSLSIPGKQAHNVKRFTMQRHFLPHATVLSTLLCEHA